MQKQLENYASRGDSDAQLVALLHQIFTRISVLEAADPNAPKEEGGFVMKSEMGNLWDNLSALRTSVNELRESVREAIELTNLNTDQLPQLVKELIEKHFEEGLERVLTKFREGVPPSENPDIPATEPGRG